MSINLTQKFVYETDDMESLKTVMRTMFPIVFKGEEETAYSRLFMGTGEIHSIFSGRGEEYVEYEGDRKSSKKRTTMFVCAVKDYKGDCHEELGDRYYDSFEQIIQAVVDELQRVDMQKFRDTCGRGYSYGFLSSDGSIEPGYRMEIDRSAWPGFNFSICHILYGK